MNTVDNSVIPDGFRLNAAGHLIPEGQVKQIDKLRDQLVHELMDGARAANAVLSSFRAQAFADIAAFVELSAAEYRVKMGGKKGNVSLLSFDGRYKIQRALAESITFDERLQAAKELIDACLRDWSRDAQPELVTLINDAFRVDQAGNIRTGSVLALRRHDIADERWQMAMKAIGDSVQVTGSKSYVRFYERNAEGGYDAISLDIAGV